MISQLVRYFSSSSDRVHHVLCTQSLLRRTPGTPTGEHSVIQLTVAVCSISKVTEVGRSEMGYRVLHKKVHPRHRIDYHH